jgi:transporter family-2 protein
MTIELTDNHHKDAVNEKNHENNINGTAREEISPTPANSSFARSATSPSSTILSSPRSTPPLHRLILLNIIAFLVGMILVIQAGLNVRLGKLLGHGLRSAFISFVQSSIVIFIAVIPQLCSNLKKFIESFREAKAQQNSYLYQWYNLLGGLVGATFISISIIIINLTGYSVYFVCSVCGQIISSVAFDQFGWLGYKKQPLNWIKLAGMVGTIAGALLLQDFASNSNSAGLIVTSCLLGVFSGLIQPLQSALNKSVTQQRLNSPVVGVELSFLVGTLALLIANGFVLIVVPFEWNSSELIWWQWFPGFLGVAIVYFGITIPPVIGLASYFVSYIAGQLVMSIITDALGLFGKVNSHATSIQGIVGVILAFAGAAAIALTKRTKSSGNQEENGEKHSREQAAASKDHNNNNNNSPLGNKDSSGLLMISIVPKSAAS